MNDSNESNRGGKIVQVGQVNEIDTALPITISERFSQQVIPGLLLQAIVLPGDVTQEGRLIEAVAFPWFKIIEMIQRDPNVIYQLDWRQWEEIIAGAYKQQGFDVVLTDDIHNRLKQKGSALSLQVDVTATPKHNNGAIFVQTVADYPLVEAIKQNVVKHPVLPDAPSRAKLVERHSAKYTEKYADYIHLGVIEWRKAYAEHEKLGKKAILFVMTDDTRNCDDVAEYLERNYSDLQGAVLVIHTKSNGEISESTSGKSKEELDKLREQANTIDGLDSPYKAIISVMVLKEGWDVRNVTTIVGLRAYSAKSNILPEQTLGRGLRKMYSDVEEYVSVVGTNAFMDFVESIQAEGVVLERKPMGEGTQPKTPLVVEIDKENEKKDIDALDIEIPVMTPRSTGNTRTSRRWTWARTGINVWPTGNSARRNSGRSFSRTASAAR